MNATLQNRLLEFLQSELAIPADAIDLALRHPTLMTYQIPMVLWQYGLVTLSQLNSIFDWLETTSSELTQH